MEFRRKALLLAGAGSCFMAVVHVFLPATYGWGQYLGMVSRPLATTILCINIFLSFLLLWGGCLTILAARRRGRLGPVGQVILYALATFWALYVLYQVRVPPPVPVTLQVTLTALGAIIALLYLVFLVTRGSERPRANAGLGSPGTKSATTAEPGPQAGSS